MNKYISLLCVLAAAVTINSCKEDFSSPVYQPLVPVDNDVNGGSWKTIVIASADEYSVPTPETPESAAYKQELDFVKKLISSRTKQQSDDAQYWASGAVQRWNQIARGLVAKYNVAPNFNYDSAAKNNPFPLMEPPFANPPIASRIYAYLSVAQYDALVAVWKAKFRHNRKRPSQYDAGINEAIAVPDIPSYPSEHAAIAVASCEILAAFFPKEKAFLEERAMNHMESRLYAGLNVPSDNKAGDSIGRFVAKKCIARSKTDGAAAAGKPNKEKYPHYSLPGTDEYGKPNEYSSPSWVSLEKQLDGKTARPAMLPGWGAVKLWGSKTSEQLRISPPPKIGTQEFQKALDEVRDIAENRTREQWKIADFWADGANTFTPPGHWNHIADSLLRFSNWSELRAARTFALMNMAVMDAGVSCWDNKFFYVFPRPSQMNPEIKTATGIPNFPSYTSGHATFSSSGAAVLGYIFPSEAAQLRKQAEEAAMSRLYGGIHYRFDNDGGLKCGEEVAKEIIDIGKKDGSGL